MIVIILLISLLGITQSSMCMGTPNSTAIVELRDSANNIVTKVNMDVYNKLKNIHPAFYQRPLEQTGPQQYRVLTGLSSQEINKVLQRASQNLANISVPQVPKDTMNIW